MWNAILTHHFDLIGFSLFAFVTTFAADRWLRRAGVARGVGGRGWLLVVLLLAAGLPIAYIAGEFERAQLKRMIEGFAPTYASEIARMGHASIQAGTDPQDPRYLQLIEAEKQWLKINPAVNDIYTIRRNAEGNFVFIVDSETDYDRNGQYEGEREERTDIGEVYDQHPESYANALNGLPGFDDQPTTDRWGTWVTATCPILDANGNVEAAVGVDFDAKNWIRQILATRGSVLGFVAIGFLIVIGSRGTIMLARTELARRREAEDAALRAQSRLQTILDHEPEGVLVCSAEALIRQLNPSSLHLLQLEDTNVDAFTSLLPFVHLDEQPGFARWLDSIAHGQPGKRTVRLFGARGSERWVEVHGVPLRWTSDPAPEVLLVLRDITAARAAEIERENLQRQLVDASRQAGMAEIATGILHNVGNVLNTVNVSAHVLTDKLRQSRVVSVGRAADLLIEKKSQLDTFLTSDDRGKQFPDYLGKLASALRSEHEEMLGTLRQMSDGLDHLKSIVHSQQSFAGPVKVEETLRPAAVFEEALKLNIASCERHHVEIERHFAELPAFSIDKHKTIQVLINLIANAKDAVKARTDGTGKITLRLQMVETETGPYAAFSVKDNGIGIPPENVSKIFAMGFTTRKDGHGFGLHSSANFAKEMGGRLTLHSDGVGQGASFTLHLPIRHSEVRV